MYEGSPPRSVSKTPPVKKPYSTILIFAANGGGASSLRDVAKKKPENVGIFPKSGTTPPPPVWDFFPILPFIFGRSPMLKTVKKMEVGTV